MTGEILSLTETAMGVPSKSVILSVVSLCAHINASEIRALSFFDEVELLFAALEALGEIRMHEFT